MIPPLDPALELAVAHYRAGRLAEAEAICRQMLAREPHHAGALHWLGVIALAAGHVEAAVELMSNAVAQAPGEAAFHCDLGAAHRIAGRVEVAVDCFRRALELDPDHADAHLNLGEALTELGRFEEAIPSCRRGAGLRPDYAVAHNNLGNALARLEQHEEARACYQRALALAPDYAEAHHNLGNIFFSLEEWSEAATCFERAIALRPDYAEAHHGLSKARLETGTLDDAIASSRRVLALKPELPESHCNLGILLLLGGQYEEGWREYEWRRHSPEMAIAPRDLTAPQWDGTPAPGRTILVHAEQGFGDSIQFLRYLPLVRAHAKAAQVWFECPRELERLCRQRDGWQAEIVVRGGAAPPQCDLHAPLLSLPWMLGRFEPLPMSAPYLQAGEECRATWRQRLGAAPAFRVGLVWTGSRRHAKDRPRSLPFETLAPLLRVPGVTFLGISGFRDFGIPGIEDSRAAATFLFPGGEATENPNPGVFPLADFANTASLMMELDLVISVDTAAAHLAGALGRPVWTLLHFVPDWRWGLDREDTPWYPTMRLFRQRSSGDWESVVARIADELQRIRR